MDPLGMEIVFEKVTVLNLLYASTLAGGLSVMFVSMLKDASKELIHLLKWHRALLRVLSILIGFGLGLLFWRNHPSFWLWGTVTGILGGGTGTGSYALLKGLSKQAVKWRQGEVALENQRRIDNGK